MSLLWEIMASVLGVSLGVYFGPRVDPSWIDSCRGFVWRLLHLRGCPFPLHPVRKERIESYQAFDEVLGISFQAEVFDIRAKCQRCGRVHRVEMKIFSQINPQS